MNLDLYLKQFSYSPAPSLFADLERKTSLENVEVESLKVLKYINEFWTSKQRQANSLHEIAYRACFKPQLPRFFIKLLSSPGDIIYDPFAGRGTTIIEAAILGRNVISNDINPLSKILSAPRLSPPALGELDKRLKAIDFTKKIKADRDLSMFFHSNTESEIVNLREYLNNRRKSGLEDELDSWIRMVATNRLTGHSNGFFSVYTLPPNQAVKPESQIRINLKRNQVPEYRSVKTLILKKSKELLKDVDGMTIFQLKKVGKKAVFLNEDARRTKQIKSGSVQLTVTSPPFLDVVQYSDDNWMRCWFNGIEMAKIEQKITMSKSVEQWSKVMQAVLNELYRITKRNGWVAFEVGEIKNRKIKLDEVVLPLGKKAGFNPKGVMINEQVFTKTSNIWGIRNNFKGTNSNRIVLFQKGE